MRVLPDSLYYSLLTTCLNYLFYIASFIKGKQNNKGNKTKEKFFFYFLSIIIFFIYYNILQGNLFAYFYYIGFFNNFIIN